MGYVYLLEFLVVVIASILWVIGISKAVDDDAWDNNEDDEFLKKK